MQAEYNTISYSSKIDFNDLYDDLVNEKQNNAATGRLNASTSSIQTPNISQIWQKCGNEDDVDTDLLDEVDFLQQQESSIHLVDDLQYHNEPARNGQPGRHGLVFEIINQSVNDLYLRNAHAQTSLDWLNESDFGFQVWCSVGGADTRDVREHLAAVHKKVIGCSGKLNILYMRDPLPKSTQVDLF